MKQVTAKVKVANREEVGDGQVFLEFQADYEDGRNKEWAKYTPGMSINTTMKGEVAEQFQVGDAFTLTFSKEE